MYINKLNQLYKPDRVLYYIDADADMIASFKKGEICDAIGKYANAFGTYDYPGVFFVDGLEKEVIGIEYRPGDDKVEYPSGLKSVELRGAYYYSVEIDSDIDIGFEALQKLFKKMAEDDDAFRQYTKLKISDDPQIISVFWQGEKYRILYEWKVTEERALAVMKDDYDQLDKELLYKTAFFDPITGHYNWNHIMPFLEMPIEAGIKDFAFAHFDIKEFRILNEVYGHNVANRVLENVVRAMNEADFVYTSARCHNDNFCMMIKDMPEEETISRLKAFFKELSYFPEDPNYRIYFRCGVVPMQRSLLSGNRVADAGKLAQRLGTNHNVTEIIMYTDKMHDDIVWSNYIKAYLEKAILNDEFEVYLQPKFDITSGSVKGAEALIRWRYKGKELLAPNRFVPFFEADGSIGKIDDIVLDKVCAKLAEWKEKGLPLYPISVNLSRSRLYVKGLTDSLAEIVDSHNVDHSLIDFELTESASYDNRERMFVVLNRLREKGFKISMDDFGTGYSSLSLLTELPIDTLKIDKSFVDKVGTDSDNEKDITVVKYIISLANELNLVCLAEGAEEKKQVEKLKEFGCNFIQGYYFSKPIPIEEYEEKYLKKA
ncbi:MAG: EAL domain-containing protein [Lachnospiraceae bacterium]|nr:EAL domain-containing protein [Lachnospiraceae bacterium]